MEYTIFKLNFRTGVHFGSGMLNQSEYTFPSDQLFSALYIEAIKMGEEKQLLQSAAAGRLLFSDLLPFVGAQYMIPKPMLYVEPKNRGISEQKKLFKKMKYLPIESLQDFLDGALDLKENPMDRLGSYSQQTMASVREEEETVPFRVGTFYFAQDNGLYLMLAYEDEKEKNLAKQLLTSVSYTGIGGKKNTGLGKFIMTEETVPEAYLEHVQKNTQGRKMTLSVTLPKEDELDHALEGASYQLAKRSGFVASEAFADEWRRKKDLYVFAAGSCFDNAFEGDIYDVAIGGNHPVYRYAKPFMMSVCGAKGE